MASPSPAAGAAIARKWPRQYRWPGQRRSGLCRAPCALPLILTTTARLSYFGNEDLRADLDSVVVGSKVTKDTDLADALRSYYANLTDYDRAREFISLSFGTVDTSSTCLCRRRVPRSAGRFRYAAAVLHERYVDRCKGWADQGRLRPRRARRQQTCLPSTWPTRSTTRRSRARRTTAWLPWAGRRWPMRWRRWATPTPPRPH